MPCTRSRSPVRCEPAQLREAILETYQFHRLGIAEFDAETGAYHHETDYAPEVEVLPDDSAPGQRLNAQLSAELNRPFTRPRSRPFRFSILMTDHDAHYVNVTYDHWVADSIALRLVLRHVLGRYLQIDDPDLRHPLTLHPGTFRDAFAKRMGFVRKTRVAGRAVTQWLQGRQWLRYPIRAAPK